MYQVRLRQLLRTLWSRLLWLVLILMGARLAMFHAFIDPAQLVGKGDDVLRMWITGLRYDLRIAGIVIAPFLLLGVGLANWDRGWQTLQRLLPTLLWLFTFVVASVAIANYFYYQTYHNHIDLFAFGLIDDDTRAVLANLWQDYPVLKGVGVALLLSLLPQWLAHRIPQATPRLWPRPRFWGVLALSLILIGIAVRGSVGTFPLRRGNAQVSDLTVLNKLTPNGLFAIEWAIKDRKEDIRFERVSTVEGDRLLRVMGFDSLEKRTPANPWLAAHRPHVVMTLMESFGSNLLALDEPGSNDLLGSLRDAFRDDFLFRRFVSEGNGTAPSLAALLFHSPMQNISHSSAQSIPLAGTPFATYKQAGYRVVFISPGNLMWRNLVNYLPVQGVDEIYDQNTLMERYPAAASELTDWGVPDEYGYQLAEQLLKDATQPLFITILTVTNHPPYVVPRHYNPQPVALTEAVRQHAEEGQISQLNILRTYQYAADAFGDFVANIKASPLAERTLLAATGDHQMRRVKAHYPVEQVLDRAVPFYLYVPKTIQAQVPLRFEPDRVGSHKDIFPTLYAFSLSDTPYQALGGRNMLAPIDDPARAFGYNETIWIDGNGAYPLNGKAMHYSWANSTNSDISGYGGDLLLDGTATPMAEHKVEALNAYQKLLRWQLNARVVGTSP